MDKMNSNGLGSFSYMGTGSTALGLVGSMTGSGHVRSQSYQYEWKYYYSPYGIDKAQKYNSGQLLTTIDATTAPNGRMVSLYYQDHTCQTNCFQGEASAIYDPCGNMISLVANSTGAEVWARAVDKNSDATIGIYNPYNMEIPFSAQATIHPSYDQPINGPIEFHIPEQGQWDLKELLANMTRVNTTIGENGVDASSSGDDDCEDSTCGFNVHCDLSKCSDKLLDMFGRFKDIPVSLYNCLFVSCRQELWLEVSNEHFAKESDLMDQAHAMSVYDEDKAARLYKEAHFHGILGSIYLDRSIECLYWMRDNVDDCQKLLNGEDQ
jgi:hypothetical protein